MSAQNVGRQAGDSLSSWSQQVYLFVRVVHTPGWYLSANPPPIPLHSTKTNHQVMTDDRFKLEECYKCYKILSRRATGKSDSRKWTHVLGEQQSICPSSRSFEHWYIAWECWNYSVSYLHTRPAHLSIQYCAQQHVNTNLESMLPFHLVEISFFNHSYST